MMMMMMMCKRLAQVPMLRVPIYNMKLAMMQNKKQKQKKNSHFYHVFSTYEDGRRQARARRGVCPYMYVYIIVYIYIYIYLFIYLFIYYIVLYIYIYTYVCFIYTYAYTHTHIYIYIYKDTCVAWQI